MFLSFKLFYCACIEVNHSSLTLSRLELFLFFLTFSPVTTDDADANCINAYESSLSSLDSLLEIDDVLEGLVRGDKVEQLEAEAAAMMFGKAKVLIVDLFLLCFLL